MAARAPSEYRARPLDAPALERLALRYVERFATTRGKLTDYLTRKVRERGWEGPESDPRAIADRMASLGYVDDRGFAVARAAAMSRRGLGGRRITASLRQAGVEEEDRLAAADGIADEADAAARAYARRRRLGPFGPPVADRAGHARQMAAMLRAGHAPAVARRVLAGNAPTGDDADDCASGATC